MEIEKWAEAADSPLLRLLNSFSLLFKQRHILMKKQRFQMQTLIKEKKMRKEEKKKNREKMKRIKMQIFLTKR